MQRSLDTRSQNSLEQGLSCILQREFSVPADDDALFLSYQMNARLGKSGSGRLSVCVLNNTAERATQFIYGNSIDRALKYRSWRRSCLIVAILQFLHLRASETTTTGKNGK